MVISVYFCYQSAALLNTVQLSVYISKLVILGQLQFVRRERLNEVVIVGKRG